MWGLPMSRGRVASLEDWLVKAPPSYANHETQPKALSRHWIGQDLRAPEAYGGRGRRETDVRDGQPGPVGAVEPRAAGCAAVGGGGARHRGGVCHGLALCERAAVQVEAGSRRVAPQARPI